MARPRARAAALPTRDRLLTAATAEFAARGFDGTKVERIATRARLTKAMVYYHFRSKAELYQTILLEQFRRVSTAVAAVRDAGGSPDEQLRGFVHAVTEQLLAQAEFPSLWLREVADGGRHLSPNVVSHMRRIIEILGVIMAEGRAVGAFTTANPFVVQVCLVAPLLFFSAATPVRERFRGLVPRSVTEAQRQEMAAHVLNATLAAVSLSGGTPPLRAVSPRRHTS